jgi:hypothetical protein
MSDLRDALESAVNTAEGITPIAVTPPVVSTPSPSPAPVVSPTPAAPAPVVSTTPTGAPAPVAAPTASQGAPGTTPPIEPAPKPGETTTDPATTPVAIKAPGTWTPAAREHWATLPQEVRDEVYKRERDVSKALSHSTEARRFTQEFNQAVQPFLGFIAAENSNPLQATVNMMQTAALLRVGTPQQKTQVVVDIIRNFGIDLMALDSALAGVQQQHQDPASLVQQHVQAALRPILQQQEEYQRQFASTIDSEVDQELSEFAGKHEFYGDVKETMADIIEMAAKRGGHMGLSTAYERAILLHEPVRRVIEARKTQTTAQTAAPSCHRRSAGRSKRHPE